MADCIRILVCSDIHYASDLEKQRIDYELNAASNPVQRSLLRLYRHHVWLRDPFAHNHLLDRVLDPPFEPDYVVANGDFSCDSAFIGVSDPAALASAQECLGKIRSRFPEKSFGVFGDHELGKISLCGGKGGLRLASLEIAQRDLSLAPLWTKRLGKYLLVGVTSSLIAMPVYERETLDSERPQWNEIARQHLHGINAIFNSLAPRDRLLLFCHDPTALPYLWELDAVRNHAHQIEKTIIGHLHSPLVFKQSRILSGMPRVTVFGSAIRRISSALSRAKHWRPFNVLLCPSLVGLQLNRTGGFYQLDLDPSAHDTARFTLHPIKW